MGQPGTSSPALRGHSQATSPTEDAAQAGREVGGQAEPFRKAMSSGRVPLGCKGRRGASTSPGGAGAGAGSTEAQSLWGTAPQGVGNGGWGMEPNAFPPPASRSLPPPWRVQLCFLERVRRGRRRSGGCAHRLWTLPRDQAPSSLGHCSAPQPRHVPATGREAGGPGPAAQSGRGNAGNR